MYQNQQRIPCAIRAQDSEELTMTAVVERKTRGLVGLEEDHLVLQLQTTVKKTSMSTMAVQTDPGRVLEWRIPLDGLASVHGGGWWGRRMKIVANDLTLFEGIPGASTERLVLTFRRRDRVLADELIAALGFALSDLGMKKLDDRIRRLEGGEEADTLHG